MKHLRTTVVILLLVITLGWWFLAQTKPAAKAPNAPPPAKTTALNHPPSATPPTVAAPKSAPTKLLPSIEGATAPILADEGPPPVPTIALNGEKLTPGVPGPVTEWGEVSFTEGVPVSLRLVTGHSATITPHIRPDGSIDLHVQIKYPTENDLLTLPVITANSGEAISIPFYDFEAKLIPTAN